MSVDVSETRTGFDASGSIVSVGGTGKKSVSASVSNGTDSEGGTLSDMVTEI